MNILNKLKRSLIWTPSFILIFYSALSFSQLKLNQNVVMNLSNGTFMVVDNFDLINSSTSTIKGAGNLFLNEGVINNMNTISVDLRWSNSNTQVASLGTLTNFTIDNIPALTINASSNILGDLTINNTNVSVDSSFSLFVAGDIVNTGLFSGSLVLNGSSLQSVGIGAIESLEIDNVNGVILTDNLEINSKLTLSNGVVTTNGYDLKLQADTNTNGIIVKGLGEINGNVIVEQFIPEFGYGHHYLSTPAKNTLFSELNDDFSLNLNSSFPYLYYYNEPNSSWASPSLNSDTMVLGKGYTGYFNGDRFVDIKGEVNSGDTPVNLTADSDGWNFIGNPYPSAIDWDLVTVPQGVSAAIYVWNHNPINWGKYTTYFDGLSINGGSNIIPMMQSFFIKSTSATTIIFQDNDRITDPNINGNFYKVSTSTSNDPLIKLSAGNQHFQTESVIRFKHGATYDYDLLHDALMFPSGNPLGVEFASVSNDNYNLVVNSIPDLTLNVTIPLFFTVGTTDVYTIEMIEFNNFFITDVYLHDTKLSVLHLLNTGPYSFVGDSIDLDSRFYIETVDITTEVNEVSVNQDYFVYLSNNNINIKFKTGLKENKRIVIYNMLGQIIFGKELIKGSILYTIDKNKIKGNGIYIIECIELKKAKKIVIVKN